MPRKLISAISAIAGVMLSPSVIADDGLPSGCDNCDGQTSTVLEQNNRYEVRPTATSNPTANGGDSNSNSTQKVEVTNRNSSVNLPSSSDKSGTDNPSVLEFGDFKVKVLIIRGTRQIGLTVLGNGGSLSQTFLFEEKDSIDRWANTHDRAMILLDKIIAGDLPRGFLDLVKASNIKSQSNTSISATGGAGGDANADANSTSTPGSTRVTTPPPNRGNDAQGAGAK
jgi:hypothetical protein